MVIMKANRSVPTDTMLAHMRYSDLPAAIAWLSRTFGFVEHYRYGDPVTGAQMHLGNAWFMLHEARAGSGPQTLTIFVDDVEAHYRRSKSAGAVIVEEPHETVYGEFQYAAEDPEGHRWLFSRHVRDANPEDWGAAVASQPLPWWATLPRPRFCYLEVPAPDPERSADFYQRTFGWNIRHRGTGRPSFDDAAGVISGAFVKDREIAGKPGILPYIWVDSISALLPAVIANGGTVIEDPHPDHPGGSCL